MSCGVRRPVPCAASLDPMGWTVPDHAAHVPCRGYLRLYPHSSAGRGFVDDSLPILTSKQIQIVYVFIG